MIRPDGSEAWLCLTSQLTMVRSYAPYDKTKQRSTAGCKKERRERLATEWDVRIDCDQKYLEEILRNLNKNENLISYCLVSGLEQPDNAKYGSKDIHTHIALILQYGMRRDQVLGLCRGLLKKTEEYCTPRNAKFTYAGWYLHHTKVDYKLVLEPPFRLEIGILPEDEVTPDTKKEVKRMFNQFARDEPGHEQAMRAKFAKWLS